MLRHTIGELVELLDKVANVDTTHRVRLGEGHALREPMPGYQQRTHSTHIAICSLSPVASQHTLDTWLNSCWSLTSIGW